MENWQTFQELITKKRFRKCAKWIVEHPKNTEEVLHDFFASDIRKLQTYSHIFDRLKPKNHIIFEPYYGIWLNELNYSHNNAFKRNSFRYFQNIKVPENNQGKLYQLAYESFMNPKEAIAIRVFAMSTCFTIAKQYKELLAELKESILLVQKENNLSAGMKSRIKKLLAETDNDHK